MRTDEADGKRDGRRRRLHPEPAQPAPTRRGVPLLGNIPQIRREGLLPFLERLHAEQGDVARVRLGPRSMVSVRHPDAFERILASHHRHWKKGPSYDVAREFFGDSLVTMETEVWRPRRRLMQPYFHRAGLEILLTTMVEVIERYLDGLKRRFPEGGEIDIHHEMIDLTLDIVCTALFGPGLTRSDDLSTETLTGMVEVMDSGLVNPFPRWLPTPLNRRFKRVRGEVDTLMYRVIERGRQSRRTEDGSSTLLGMLLDTADEDGKALCTEDVRNELVTLYVAGHETTALTMTWLFALLDGSPEVFERLRGESDAVLEGQRPRFDQLPSLRYTRKVVDEVLRLRNPAPLLSRSPDEPDNLCGVHIDAGQMVMLNFWSLHRHPDYWPEPERFDPERFTPDAIAERDSWSYLPFSGGPRTCIGNNFALYESQLIIAMMMQRAKWEVPKGQTIEPEITGTLRPKQPVRVRFSWRSPEAVDRA